MTLSYTNILKFHTETPHYHQSVFGSYVKQGDMPNLKAQKLINESVIFDAYERMRAIEQESIHKSKAAKRAAQRRKSHNESEKPNLASILKQNQTVTSTIPSLSESDIKPFDDLDDSI